ncbi:hypothetical protein [Streptomyces sp. NPDC048638]|uniref:hypothetical protein n=1 Tax=Streptomyces sp. NPDC048638 TaxID=3365580 RepID=UPI00371708B6
MAAYLDRLPDGADISVKTLAKVLPTYGQCALRTALRRLSEAGHLRRITETLTGDGGSPVWVTRTYFSRTARGDAWWAAFRAGNVPEPASPAPAPQEHEPPPPQHPHPHGNAHNHAHSHSRAYDLLASLGRAEPRMTLSAADCAALEALAEEWLTRGATPDHLLRALTAGLPPEGVHHPGHFARARLLAKMPPPAPQAPSDAGPPPPRPPLRILECTVCRTPGRPEALPGSICAPCRGQSPPATRHQATADAVRARVRALRHAARAPEHRLEGVEAVAGVSKASVRRHHVNSPAGQRTSRTADTVRPASGPGADGPADSRTQ